jgi:mannose-6-phosphate isomerase-like protein (cupin superfamily)
MSNATDQFETPRFRVRAASAVEEVHHPNNIYVRSMFTVADEIFESSFQFMLVNRLPAGEVNAAHTHDDVEKLYYFLGGNGEVTCGPTTTNVRAGDCLFFPAAIEHQIRSLGPDELTFVVCAAKTLESPKGLGL